MGNCCANVHHVLDMTSITSFNIMIIIDKIYFHGQRQRVSPITEWAGR